MFCDCFVIFPHDAMGLSTVCDCGISWSCSLTIFEFKLAIPKISDEFLAWHIQPILIIQPTLGF